MANRKIKVLFFGEDWGGGGEKVIGTLLNNINKNKFDLVLFFLKKDKGIFFDRVKKDVKVVAKDDKLKDRNLPSRTFRHIKRFYNVCKIINSEKPNVIMCISNTLSPMVIFGKLFAPKTKVIIDIQIDISAALKENFDAKNKFFDKIRRELSLYKLYGIADKVICVSKSIAIDINKNFGVPKNKIVVIYNPLNINEIDELKNEEIYDVWFKNNNPKILSVGRLNPQKGYEYLLKAFKIVRREGTNANLIILGEGAEREKLENLARILGVENYVVLAGFKENPYKYMKNSDIFVLSSIYEGFGNVVVEAMACGVPIIATRCPSGPDEIITNDVNGMLVPIKDEKALANVIINLLKDKNKTEMLAKEGIKRVNDFNVEKIVKEYEKIFESIK